ncbi:hypothetical protein [Thiohalophilus sp.]|uniref:hypothetical protein n=1 Tax=Thiohalophilus sp. TaxID=3028392 RepID=UPI0039762530
MTEQVEGYICFYTDHIAEEFVSIDEARYMALEQILTILQGGVLGYPRNLLGIIDEKGNSLQFFVQPEGGIELNLSVPEEFGSYTRQIEPFECYTLLKKGCRYIEHMPVGKVEFSGWWIE